MDYSTWGDVNEKLRSLKEGEGLEFAKVGYDILARTFTLEELVDFATKTADTHCHVVCFANRPGAEFFYNYLEQNFFPPDTPENDEYKYAIFRWEHMAYIIGSVPIEKMNCVEEAAEAAGMKTQKGAVPFTAGIVRGCLNPKKAADFEGELKDFLKWFPVNTPHTWTLETAKADSPLYSNAGGEQDLHAEYDFKLKQLLEEKGLSWENHLKRRRSK